jgi:hypothetical protein
MKIIQSFWSGNQKKTDGNYGWFDSKSHWMGWILSVNQLIKYYENVELYTDDFGYDVLINKLGLPYTKVHVVLNELNDFPCELWALAKIKVYSMQEEPFIHIDGDVFIWNAFPDNFNSANLIAQNKERTTNYHSVMWEKLAPFLVFIPLEIQSFEKNVSRLSANMGITGGTNVLFFKEYAKKAFGFVEKNKQIWNKVNLLNFNIFFEQVLFYKMTEIENITIDYLFSEIWTDDFYPGFGDFHHVPHQRTYLHLLGDFKRNPKVCEALEGYVIRFYPNYYAKLMQLLSIESTDEKKYFLNEETVEELLKEFELEVIKNDFTASNFILKRDLNNVGLNQLYNSYLDNKTDFKIVLFPEFEIIEKGDIKFFEVYKDDTVANSFELDELDEILLEELKNPEIYSNLIQKMKFYLEDENGQSVIPDLNHVINCKLDIYITQKIITIYSDNPIEVL